MQTASEGASAETEVGTRSVTARVRDALAATSLSLAVRLGVLVVLVVVAISRSPHIFRRGRLWAEEGAVFFGHMYETPGPSGLWFAQSRAGYTNAIANIATWLANLVPLRHGPRVTVWVSFAVLLVLVWIVLSWPSDLLINAASRLAAAVVLMVGTFAIAEIWVNSINAQVYLGLLTVVLLVARLRDVSRRQFVVGGALLALAGLSGIYAAVLAPVYLLAAWREGGRRRWIYGAILTATAVAQGLIYLSASSAGRAGKNRSLIPEAGKAYDGLVGYQFAGSITPQKLLGNLMRPADQGGSRVLVTLVAIVVIVAVVLALLTVRRRVAVLLVGSFVLVELTVQAGAIGGVAAGRYAAMPIGIIALTLIGGAAASAHRWRTWVIGATAALVVVVGLSQFWTTSPKVLRCEGCPSWAGEVERFEQGKTDELEIWPYDRKEPWVVELSRAVNAAAVDLEEPEPEPPSDRASASGGG